MSFYYLSIFSIVLLATIYFVGTWVLVAFGAWLKRRWRPAWRVMVPLFLLLYLGPVAEELWIAWNFGRLCRKDAGLFIHKTVEVEGFYDDTRPTHAGLRSKQAAEELDKGGFRFYEMVFPDFKGGPNKVVHLEKVNGEWTATVLDRPTARYHYRWPHMHTPVAYKVKAFEWIVRDVEQQLVIAREKAYAREAPWFFLGLDRPTMFCPVFGSYGEKLTGGLYRLVLKPSK